MYWFTVGFAASAILLVFLILATVFFIILSIINFIRPLKLFKFVTTRKCALLLALIVTAYGVWEGVRVPDVVRHDVYVQGLSPEFFPNGLKVLVMCDFHIGIINGRNFVQAVVDRANALSPDIILMPGDFVDGTVDELSRDVEPLGQLRARLGVYGTSGNHEYYSGYDKWRTYLEGLGIRILENEHVCVAAGDNNIIIAGVPDVQGARPGFGFTEAFPAPDLRAALEEDLRPYGFGRKVDVNLTGSGSGALLLLMDHRPSAARANAEIIGGMVSGAGASGAGINNINVIQVSGHTHGGQVPLLSEVIADRNDGYVSGWYDINNNNNFTYRLYVSPGVSQWSGFPVRLPFFNFNYCPSTELSLLVLRGLEDLRPYGFGRKVGGFTAIR